MSILATSYKYVKSTKKMSNDIKLQIKYYNKVHSTFADLAFIGKYDKSSGCIKRIKSTII